MTIAQSSSHLICYGYILFSNSVVWELCSDNTCMTYRHHLYCGLDLKAEHEDKSISRYMRFMAAECYLYYAVHSEIDDSIRNGIGHSESYFPLSVASLRLAVAICLPNKKTMKSVKCEICQKEKALSYVDENSRVGCYVCALM